MSILVGATSGLAGAAGQGPSADLGDTIDQSLRFNGSEELKRSSVRSASNASATISVWIKLGEITTSVRRILTIESSGGTWGFGLIYINSNIAVYDSSSADGNRSISDGVLRDPSAWYHIVYNRSAGGTDQELYINGVLQDGSASFATSVDLFSIKHEIGNRDGDPTTAWVGYLADFHFVDGSKLDPTSFGKTNGDGVWVPINYSGGHGSMGYYLPFDSSADGGIGDDASTNADDFTATGFDTADVVLYTGNEAGSTSTYESDSANRTQSLSNAGSTFDGDTAGGTQVSGGGGGYWYLENKSFSSLTGLRLLWGDPSQCADIRLNGTSVSFSTSGSYTVVDTADIPATVTEIAARRDRDNTQVLQVEVNTGSGFVALLDNTDNDVDFLDTPTSNYATFNPLNTTGGDDGIQSANLEVTDTGNTTAALATASMAMTSGKYYFEFVRKDVDNGTEYGIKPADTHISGNLSGYSNGVHIENTGDVYVNGSRTQENYLTDLADDDVLNVAFDADTRKVWFGRNGTFVGDPAAGTSEAATHDQSDVGYIPWIRVVGSGSNETGAINFGQMPFINTPPAGYSALQTNNLPEPTIKNGKEYFDVVTWSGDGTSPRTIATEFQPDLVWIKSRSNATSHFLYDSVRGFGNSNELSSNSTRQEGDGTTNTAANGYVSGVTSSGFTLTAGTSGDNYTNDSSRTYVGWAWKAGGTAVSNTDGTITSSVSANTDAGFSIVTYSGQASAGTVGHGLSNPPEFIIIKARNNVGGIQRNWICFHTSIGNNGFLILDLNGTTGTPTGVWNTTDPGNQVFSLGGSVNETNTSGGNYVAYCWHSVEGYSKFGGYTGSSGADNTFEYLGFTPAFLMVKCTSHSGNWVIKDTTRSTSNPSTDNLYANENLGTQSALDIDLLSNGFKIREERTDTGYDTRTYVYIAFASSPFGGENAPPATAR